MHYSLLYISRIAKVADADVLNRIRKESIERNAIAGLTGLLLWSQDHFCQILQGEKSAVEETMERIARDSRHVEPIVLLRTDLAEALFPDWTMATSHIDNSVVANEIAMAYEQRLADLRVVDGIVALMQQFQLKSPFKTPTVLAPTVLDQQLSALAAKDDSDRAIQQLLELGRSVTASAALVLLLKAPVNGAYYAKASVGIDEAAVNLLISHLSVDLTLASEQTKPVEQTKPGDVTEPGVVSASDTRSKMRKKNLTTSQQVRLPDSTGFRIATGCQISTRFSHSAVFAGDSRSGETESSQVIGVLWSLADLASVSAKDLSTEVELRRLADCVENLMEQRFQSHASELLRQKSRRQQLSLAASNRRQEMVMNLASSAIVALDRDCRVLIINDAARKMFGQIEQSVPFHWPDNIVFRAPWTLEPLSHSGCPIHLTGAGAGGLEQAAEQGAEGQHHEAHGNMVALQLNESEPLRYLRVASSATNESDSAISGVVVFDDVTELQHNRERIRRSDRLEALGHLTGGIAHDFNNLLSTIQSSVELATDETELETRGAFLEVALDSVQRGADLTDKLVAFAVARPVSAQAHPLKELMRSVTDLATASIEQDIKFVVEQVPDALAVYCDGGQLENALLNILINSRDAIIESGTGDQVSIAIKSTETRSLASLAQQPGAAGGQKAMDKVLIVVTDNGPGMSAEVIRRATDPFFTTRGGGTGSGLGLSMVYRFVEQSGGELLIENLADIKAGTTGARVTLLLDQAISRVEVVAPSVSKKPEPAHRRATILLVEDEANLAEMLQRSLHRVGLDTRVANNADSALRALRTDSDIDLLLTDIIMPGSELDGYSLAAEATRLLPDLKVVYLSGYPQPSGKSQHAMFGPLIKKPVSIDRLASVIRQELGQNNLDEEPHELVTDA